MKDITGVVERTGNVDTTGAKEGSITEAGMGVVMSILSNMYTNKFLAVLREYCMNALDSHVQSGNSQPIEVTLPSDLQPTLLIQDHGLGMTRADIETFFLEYGTSTKRDSNDLVGAFGIGSKSAFTLGHQFVVTGVKDGQKTVALLSLNESNIATCTVIKEVATDEPNGVLISLAVEDVDSMRETAAMFFSYWERGTVLVDGEEPTPVFEGATVVNDATYIQPEHEGQVIVSMGGVPYVVGRDILRKVARDLEDSPAGEQALALVDWVSSSSLILKVAIGDCDIAPNREALRDTKRTLATLERLVEGLVDDLATSVQAKVDTARNPFEARMLLERSLTDLAPFKVSRKTISFQGARLKKEIETPFSFIYLGAKGWTANNRKYSSAMVIREEDKFTVDHIRAPKTVVVTGVPESQHGRVKRYAKRFLENYTYEDVDPEQAVEYLVPVEDAQGSHEWFVWGEDGGVHTLTLDDYRSALKDITGRDPRTANAPAYTTGWQRATRDLEDRDLLTDIVSWGKDVILFHESAAHVDQIARKALEDYTPIVLLGQQSEDALRKRIAEDGSVEILDDWKPLVQAYATKVFSSITDDEKAALGAVAWLDTHYDHDWKSWRSTFGEDFSSPLFEEVADAFALAELVAADITKERKALLVAVARHLGEEVEYPAYDAEVPDFDTTFPLLRHISTWYAQRDESVRADVLAYINSK